MFNLFKSKVNNSWGLHITDRHLRLVEIGGSQNNWRILRMSRVDLPLGIIENSLIKDAKLFSDAIKNLQGKAFPSASKSPYVIVNLAEEHVFSRIVQIPPLTKEETDEAIKWEAESNIPLPIDKVYLSWEQLPNRANQPATSPSSNKHESVFLAAVSKTIVEDLQKVLKEAGLSPTVIEPESAALVRSLSKTQSFPAADIPIIILNLREHYTHIIAFNSRVVALSTTSENCSDKFDLAIENTFKIKREDCVKYRQKIGWNVNDEFGKKMIEATSIPFGALKKDIQSTMSFFVNKIGKEVKGVILTGEMLSKWNYFDRYLEGEIGIPVRWQSQWNPKIWPANCPYLTTEKEEYNIGIGLALRKLEEEF